PQRGVVGEMRTHVLVHALLQVEAEHSVGADHDIGTDTTLDRYIAQWVVEALITAVVDQGDADLLTRGIDQWLAAGANGCVPGQGQQQGEKQSEGWAHG